MNDHYPIVTEGQLVGQFTGFHDGPFSKPVFVFENGERWQQDDISYYYFYGHSIHSPNARIIKYGDGFFLIVDVIPEEINKILPRPVKVRRLNE